MKPIWIKLIKILTVVIFTTVGTVCFFYYDDEEILFESEESKTVSGGPIYNKIKWFKQGSKDIWMMKQAQNGLEKTWDRLAIVIDNNFNPGKVKFYQLEPGKLEWTGKAKQLPYMVPCFICHSNGPRAIRPIMDSQELPVSLKNQAKVMLWNIKIKSYGKLVENENQGLIDKSHSPPFRHRGKYENEILKVKTCTNCHKDSGFMARGSLNRQHITTIKHMVSKGHMPPLGFKLSEKEKLELDRFLKGF